MTPARVRYSDSFLQTVGYGLVLAYTALCLYVDVLSGLLTGLLTLGAVIAVFARRPYRRLSVVYLFYTVVLWQLITWGYNHFFYEQIAARSPKVERLGIWFLFLPVAFFLYTTQRVYCVWLLALIALLASPWSVGGGLAEVILGLQGERVEFGFNNAQHSGMLFGVALIGLTVLGSRALNYRLERANGFKNLLLLVTWLAVILGVVVTQTRAVWLGLLCSGGFALLFGGYMFFKYDRGRAEWLKIKNNKSLLAGLVILLIGTPLFFGDIVMRRVDVNAPGGILELLQNPYASKNESIQIRTTTWKESLNWIAERPIQGWGGKGSSMVVEATPELTPHQKERFRHLHNTYLDLVVKYGLVGLLLFLLLLYTLSTRLYEGYRRGVVTMELLAFWCLFVVYWLVVNFFESYMFYSTGTYAFALIAGGMLAATLPRAGTAPA